MKHKAVNLRDLLQTMEAFRALPKPLSVVFCTPTALAYLRSAHPPPSAPTSLVNGFLPPVRPLVSIDLVELPTVAECLDACERKLAAGVRAGVMTEDGFWDPVDAAREFAKRERACQ